MLVEGGGDGDTHARMSNLHGGVSLVGQMDQKISIRRRPSVFVFHQATQEPVRERETGGEERGKRGTLIIPDCYH